MHWGISSKVLVLALVFRSGDNISINWKKTKVENEHNYALWVISSEVLVLVLVFRSGDNISIN